MTQIQAARLLKISDRQISKLINRFKEEGVKSFVSKKRGSVNNRAYSNEFKEKVLSIIKKKYEGFGPSLAKEKLEELNNSPYALNRKMSPAAL